MIYLLTVILYLPAASMTQTSKDAIGRPYNEQTCEVAAKIKANELRLDKSVSKKPARRPVVLCIEKRCNADAEQTAC